MTSPAPELVESYCHCHNEVETMPEKKVFIVCFECGHIWTKRTLLKEYHIKSRISHDSLLDANWLHTTRWQEFKYWVHRWTMRADKIYFCQECIHDF